MKILTLIIFDRSDSGLGKRRPTTMRTGNNSSGPGGRQRCCSLRFGAFVALTAGLILAAAPGWASPHVGRGGGFGGFQEHGHAAQQREGGGRGTGGEMRPGTRPGQESGSRQGPGANPDVNPGMNRGTYPGMRSATGQGQQHLPAWWQAHRGLSSQQQADALRREPGFQNLPPGQLQRLLNRLHDFDQRPPQVQERMMGRNEMFERLSPERQQEVRGASQAFNHMPPERQQLMRHAFHQLRQMPPEEREQMLHSAYGAQFSPQERTVLSNFLSVEPYQPHVIQPYFGR